MQSRYFGEAVAGARSLGDAPVPERVRELRAITIPVMAPRTPDVVISRELAKEICRALEHAAGFGAYVPRAVRSNTVAEYADSIRTESTQALTRFKRAAMAGGAA